MRRLLSALCLFALHCCLANDMHIDMNVHRDKHKFDAHSAAFKKSNSPSGLNIPEAGPGRRQPTLAEIYDPDELRNLGVPDEAIAQIKVSKEMREVEEMLFADDVGDEHIDLRIAQEEKEVEDLMKIAIEAGTKMDVRDPSRAARPALAAARARPGARLRAGAGRVAACARGRPATLLGCGHPTRGPGDGTNSKLRKKKTRHVHPVIQ